MKGYKAFGKGMICQGKQYAENTVFEEDSAEICHSGMHFCKNPLDVLAYYPLVDENGDMSEFAEVEALDEPDTNDGEKYCSKKLKIGEKIDFARLVQAGVEFEMEKFEETKVKTTSKDNAQIGSSGDVAHIGSSGNDAQISSSGCYAKIGSSGNGAKIGSSGDGAQISSSGNGAKIGSSGDGAQISSSGDWAQIGSNGDGAQIGSSGDSAHIGSNGNWDHIGSSGRYAQIGSSGNRAQIGSSGNDAQISSSGKNAVIMCAGIDSCVKAKKGSWITLAEWEMVDDGWTPVCVKTMQVDGDLIKEDTFYRLKEGEFVEVEA